MSFFTFGYSDGTTRTVEALDMFYALSKLNQEGGRNAVFCIQEHAYTNVVMHLKDKMESNDRIRQFGGTLDDRSWPPADIPHL